MTPSLQAVYLVVGPVDLRASFDRLAAIVREQLGRDPKSGELFVFAGRGRDRLKALFWDESGYCILYKRLEGALAGFPSSVPEGASSVTLDAAAFRHLLRGVPSSRRGARAPLH